MTTTTSRFTIGPLDASPAEVGAVVRAAILDTAPAPVAGRLADATTAPERLERILAERTWFEARSPDGALLGVAAVHVGAGDDGACVAHLGTNMVLVRGQGIGTALVAARLSWAAAHGAARAAATTHPWNTASRANLTRAGFALTGASPDAWLGDGDILTYERTLTA